MTACTGRDGATGTDANEPGGIEADFLDVARGELAAGGDGSATADFVASRPPEARLLLARAAAADPDPAVRRLGAALLVERERYDEATAVLAELLVAGEELGRFGHGLLQGGDEAGLRVYTGLARTLLAGRDALSPEERARADEFLCRLAGRPDGYCSQDAIERRLDELERLLEEIGAGGMGDGP